MLKQSRVNLKNIILIFMVLQPFFDSYILYTDEVISFFGFSPTTIIRFALLGLICVYLFFKKLNTKENKYLFGYGIIVLVYTLLHHLVCVNVDESVLYHTFKYNLIGEIFYLFRLVYPFILVYIVYKIKITKEEFKFVIQGSSLCVSLILLGLNLFVISHTSYFSNIITGNIFDWASGDISRYMLAGKGWFNSANQIGGFLLVLIPLNFYYALKNGSKFDVINLILLIISSYSLGTRVSCIGVSLVLIVLIVAYYIFKLFRKEKLIKKEIFNTFIIMIFSLFVFNYAPVVNLSGKNLESLFNIKQVVHDTSEEIEVEIVEEYDGTQNVCEYLTKTPTNTDYYVDLYPCYDNLEFWTTYVESDYATTDNRLLETLITSEVYEKTKSSAVELFGVSRSRYESASIYLEKDIVVHYYTLGIVGICVFILPYFLICGFVGFKRLFTKQLTYWDFCLIVGILLPILVSIVTGHIIDELIVTLYIGFCLGYLLYTNFDKNKENNKLDNCSCNKDNDTRKKILFVVDENRMGGVSILLEDMFEYLDKKKYKFSILVLHDVDNYFKNLDKDIEVIYGTKFFDVIDYNLSYLIKTKDIGKIVKKLYLIFLMKTGLIKNKIIKERKKILTSNYDIEIAFKDGFTAVFTAFGNSKKKIHWLHYEYKKYNANGNYPKLFNKILPIFDKIVAVSTNVMNDFNDIYHLESKTMVVENLVNTNKILDKAKEECERKLSVSKLNIVCVGRLHTCKGFDRLINAISKLSKKEKEKISVEIYGDGEEKDKLNNLIKEFELSDIIKLKGRVDNPYKYVKGNDLFVLTSHFETFGLVIVEAMTLGVPVFALENSNTSNLIANNENGYIVNNDDDSLYGGLKYLINNKKVIDKYKKNLLNYKYDNKKVLNKINQIFDM